MQAVHAADQFPDALHALVNRIQAVCDVDHCSVFVSDTAAAEYVMMASTALPDAPEQQAAIRLPYHQGLIGQVSAREELWHTVITDPQPSDLPALLFDLKCAGFLGVPIIYRAELLGVLVVQQQVACLFSDALVSFLLTLALQLGLLFDHARAKGQLLPQSLSKRGRLPHCMTGVSGSLGVAIAKATVVFPFADLEAVPDRHVSEREAELEKFDQAIAAARLDMKALQRRAADTFSVAEQALFDAYARILDSQTFIQRITTEIKTGLWAQAALRRVIKQQALQFESSEDPYFRERGADFRDLGRRILAHLQEHKQVERTYPKRTILVGEEISATDILEVPLGQLVGVVSGSGSSHAHVAILAKGMGIPSVMGVSGLPLADLEGVNLVLDGYHAQVYIRPSQAITREFKSLLQEEQALNSELSALHDMPAETQDGHALPLHLNTGLATDGAYALRVGADGIGLYRSEMSFMLRDAFPTEEEQRVMYRQVLNTFCPKPVVMRTLDIGGDKCLPYFPIQEDNPALGWRGVRVTLDHPDLFLQQVRAMMHASVGLNNLSIMLPMISSIDQLESAIALIHQAHEQVSAVDSAIRLPPIGMMIEVPAVIYQSAAFAKRVDFLSVGSNDLVQYLLAVDRNNPRVADLYDSLHPAVLSALQRIVSAARRMRKPVSVCGELAGDPSAVLLLLAMGFDTLSMNARNVLRAKQVIRHFTLEEANTCLRTVIKMDDAREIREYMENVLSQAGLGGLIRAGK